MEDKYFEYICSQGWFQDVAEFRLGLRYTETDADFIKEIKLAIDAVQQTQGVKI